MSNPPGEPYGEDYSPDEKRFFVEVAHANLNKVTNTDTLKHFADVWWNLCNWEATRAGVLDGKAQGLLTLASIVGAVVTVSAALGGDQVAGSYWRALSIFAFVVAAALAVWALRVTEHAGFHDRSAFEALTYDGSATDWFPEFDDKDAFRLYLRETCMQRCAVYQRFRKASASKAKRVERAQYAALTGALLLAMSVVVQIMHSQASVQGGGKTPGSQSAASQAQKAAASSP